LGRSSGEIGELEESERFIGDGMGDGEDDMMGYATSCSCVALNLAAERVTAGDRLL